MFLPYIIISVVSIVLGQVVGHLNKKLPPVVKEEITYKEFFKTITQDFRVDIKYTVILLIVSNFFVYYLGDNITTYLYTVIVSMLLIVFSIDYRFQLIPDETHIVIAIVGIINLILNIQNWYIYVIGAVVGGAIFWLLGLLAIVIFKKEGMGFGDVKLMAVLGLVFGFKIILVIALLSFLIGAIVGGTLLLLRKKKTDDYIPFGPFIVLATLILMVVPADDIIFIYISFCTWIGRSITDLVYNLIK